MLLGITKNNLIIGRFHGCILPRKTQAAINKLPSFLIFRYKCHKSCAAKAPPSCGLPQELMNYFRKHLAMTSSMERLADQRVEPAAQSPSERSTPRPPIERSNTYDLDTRDSRDPEFLIQDLASEPTNSE